MNTLVVLLASAALCLGQVDVDQLNKTSRMLARQLIMQQLYIEERIRSDGDSGIKQVRVNNGGTRPYFVPSHSGPGGVASIHDHANNIRTIGMGEYVAVLNGVEFRTRHNDYSLKMPSTVSSEYGEKEDIPFPEVPPAVLQNVEVADQVVEMRKWFKAWADQDYSERDYRPYFKPVLCYLEGTWTNSDETIDEPFSSDRHEIEAETWFELQEKVRFNAYTGGKNINENLAFLPTTIMGVNGSTPIFAQWNYRIMCHPLKDDLPIDRLKVIDNIGYRTTKKITPEHFAGTRAARFKLNAQAEGNNNWRDFQTKETLLDKLMTEIPGMNNYRANIQDTAWGETAKTMNGATLNAGYYHKWYRINKKDAMGIQTRTRAYSDVNVYMAMNTQDKVAGMSATDCRWQNGQKVCETYSQKWSYAIPLEIIYLTPLSKWNPYNIEHKGNPKSDLGKAVEAGGRNGDNSLEKAYNGTNDKLYYITPAALTLGNEIGTDPADTAKGVSYFLDRSGQVRSVRASGHRVRLPYIPGVGALRQRYPIMPIHSEGNAIAKELEALKDIVLEPLKYDGMLREGAYDGLETVDLLLGPSQIDEHEHTVTISRNELNWIMANESRKIWGKWTDDANSHSHKLVLAYRKPTDVQPGHVYIVKCDWKSSCWDGHPGDLILQ